MGYYTRYALTFDAPTQVEKTWVEQAMREYSLPNYDVGTLYELWAKPFQEEPIKWYDHEKDMWVFSRQFPQVLFTLFGEGEKSGDIWRKYFKNGKMQVARAQITFAPFDEKELK